MQLHHQHQQQIAILALQACECLLKASAVFLCRANVRLPARMAPADCEAEKYKNSQLKWTLEALNSLNSRP